MPRRSTAPCSPATTSTSSPAASWIAKNPVPADRSRWGRLAELAERNQYDLRDILERRRKPDPKRSPIDQKIGDYYASCMDEAAIEAKGLAPLKPRARPDRRPEDRRRDLAPVLARLHADGVSALFRFGAQPDFKNASVDIAAARPGRALAARPRLLPQGRGAVRRRAQAVPPPRRRDVRAGGRAEGGRGQGRPDRARHRDRPRQGLARPRQAARPRQPRPPDDPQGARGAGARLRLGRLLQGHRRPGLRRAQRLLARLLQGDGPGPRRAQPRRLEDLPALAHRPRRRAAPPRGLRQRELQLLRQDPQRHQGAAAALEALRRAHRPAARRGAGPALRGGQVRRRGQGAHAEDGGGARGRPRPRHPRPPLDDRRHQEAGAREARRHRQQDRLSRPLARLLDGEDRARRRPRQRRARPEFECGAQTGEDRQAGRPAPNGG